MDERALDEAIAQTAKAEAVAPVSRRVDRVERTSSRGLRAAVAISILGLLLSFLWSGWNTRDIAQNEARNAVTQQGLDSLREVNKQLRAQGLPEIEEPAPGEPISMDELAAAAAALAKSQLEEDPNVKGRPGNTGASGPPGEPCTPQVPGCTGEPGSDGQNGAQGQPGAKGKDAPTPQFNIDGNGDLGLSFPDNQPPIILGHVVGPQGPKGDPGTTAPTVTGASFIGDGISECTLLLTFSDGSGLQVPVPNKQVCLGA